MSSHPPPTDPWTHIEPDDHGQTPPPKKRKRRRWLKVLIVLVILLVALVALLPTIVSTGPVESFVIGKVNQNLNGKVQVNDLSVGWLSGIDVNGVKVDDDQGRTILTLARLRVPLALTNAIRGNYALGDVLVDRPDLVRLEFYEDGSNNFDKLMRSDATTKPADEDDAGDGTLPQFSGNVTVNELRGTIHHPQLPAPLVIEPSSLKLNIPDSNQPIENDIKLVYRLGNDPAGTITASGKVDAIENNRVQIDKMTADEKVTIAGINFAPVGALMSTPESKTVTAGIANGAINLTSAGSGALNVAGEIKVDQFAYGGDALKGDTFRTNVLRIPINVAMNQTDPGVTVVKMSGTRVEFDQGSIDISADAPLDALTNAASSKPPGRAGKADVVIDVPKLGELANQMPNTFALVEGVQLEGGSYHHEIHVALATDKATVTTGLKLADVRGRNIETKEQLRPIDPITLDLSATSLGGGGAIPDLRDIKLALASAFATAKGGGESLAKTEITADFALAKMREQLGQYVTSLDALHSGNGKLVLTTSGDVTKPGPIATKVDVTVTDLLYVSPPSTQPTTQPSEPTRFDEKWISLTVDANLQRGEAEFIEAVRPLKLALKTGEPNKPTVDVSGGGDVSLKGGVVAGTLALDVGADLPTLHRKFAESSPKPGPKPVASAPKPPSGGDVIGRRAPAAPAAPAPAAPAEEELPPLEILSGAAKGGVTVTLGPDSKKVDVKDMRISNLALRRGPGAFKAERDMVIALAATIIGAEQTDEVRVESLDADLGVAKATLAEPLVLRDLATAMTASGTLKVDGQIDQISRLLEALGGEPAGQGYPYGGTLAMTQKIATAGNTISISGQLRATDFVVFQDGKPSFSEKELQLAQDVQVDSASKVLSIKNLILDMTSSKAMKMSIADATVRNWDTTREFDNVKADVSYDLAQVWTILRPLISEKPDDYKDLTIAGTDNRTFILRGSYPANVPFHEAIKSLEADGGFAVGQFSYLGLNVDKLEVPVMLRKGVVELAYANRPRARRYAPPASCNGGEINLAGIFLDLGQEQARLTIPKNHKLLTNVTMNPIFADSVLGSFINPTFVDPEEARGLIDIVVVACDKVPLGDLIKARNDGRAEVLMSIREVNIGNKFVNQLIGYFKPNAFKNGALQGNINNAKLVIENGLLTQDLAIQLEGVALAFDGSVRLADQALVPLNFAIPTVLMKQIPDEYRKYVPEVVKVPITGTTRAPKWNLDRVVAQLVTEAGKKALLGGALDRLGGDRKASDGGTTTAPSNDPKQRIEDLIDVLTRPKKSDEKKSDEPPAKGDEPISRPKR